MNAVLEISQPLWEESVRMPNFVPLGHNIACDVCIVGAGIAGLSTAYRLTREGKSVVVLDDGPVAAGETRRTTAHLANACDDRYYRMERFHGGEGARLIAESHGAAIDLIEATVRDERIDCDFERLDGFLFAPPGDSPGILERELEACHRAGMRDVEWVERAPIAPFYTGRCLRFPRQAQFHPLKYLASLTRALIRDGGKIYCSTHAEEMEGGANAHVTTQNGPIVDARHIVVATNSPVNDRVAIHTKQAAYRSYVIGLRVPAGSVTKALFWDTMDPYHYARIQTGNGKASSAYDVLIVGGEDHKTGQAGEEDARFENLDRWARERFPTAESADFRWSGQVMEPVDGVAFIGRNPMDEENVYICTGDSGQGMTHGTIASVLITDLIMGRQNPWTALYEPSRITLRAAAEFARENLNVAAQYTEWLTAGEVQSVEDIPPGSGGVIRRGATKIAVFRGDAGELHECSAVCPHLGGIVHWNDVEKTWDCPCHGSRFDKLGLTALNGPANSGLKAM